MVTDLIGGQVEFGTAALPSVQPHIKSGALRAIGVPRRSASPAAPDIPTFAEQGLPNFVVEAWFAVIGPKGMTAADVKRVHDAVGRRLRRPGREGSDGQAGQHHHVSTTEQAQQFFRSELAKYAKLVKKAGVEPQ